MRTTAAATTTTTRAVITPITGDAAGARWAACTTRDVEDAAAAGAALKGLVALGDDDSPRSKEIVAQNRRLH